MIKTRLKRKFIILHESVMNNSLWLEKNQFRLKRIQNLQTHATRNQNHSISSYKDVKPLNNQTKTVKRTIKPAYPPPTESLNKSVIGNKGPTHQS